MAASLQALALGRRGLDHTSRMSLIRADNHRTEPTSGYLTSPLRLLIRRPMVQIIGLILALNFAIYTLLLGTYADLFIDEHGQSQSMSSFHCIAIAIEATAAAQVGGRLIDLSYRCITARCGGSDGKPENRVPYIVPGVLITPLGLFLYGWAAEYVVAWLAVDIGAAIFTLGSSRCLGPARCSMHIS